MVQQRQLQRWPRGALLPRKSMRTRALLLCTAILVSPAFRRCGGRLLCAQCPYSLALQAKARVEIDERFSSMFEDAKFKRTTVVDKRGRKTAPKCVPGGCLL